MKTRLQHLSMAVIGTAALASSAAFGHPSLVRSQPVAGSKAKPPEQVSLWFSEKIEPVFNRIEVVDGSGTHFEAGKPKIDESNGMHLRVGLKPLPAGSYSVHWRVSASDSHKMEGVFSFQVAP